MHYQLSTRGVHLLVLVVKPHYTQQQQQQQQQQQLQRHTEEDGHKENRTTPSDKPCISPPPVPQRVSYIKNRSYYNVAANDRSLTITIANPSVWLIGRLACLPVSEWPQ